MAVRYDLLVIGAGPSGCAAAITAAKRGARVCLIDRAERSSPRPGETLHPGVEPLLDRLGVGDAIRAKDFLRFEGIRVRSSAGTDLKPFGTDTNGPWRGFQIPGQELDAILRRHAEALGVEVRGGDEARTPLLNHGRVIGARTAKSTIWANYTADCTGGRHWLARRLSIGVQRLSPPLIAHYGYAHAKAEDIDEAPLFELDTTGWTWSARIADDRVHWTRLNLAAPPPARHWRPTPWHRLPPAGPVRRANVTWRRCQAVAGKGFFLCGDAAMVLDPSSSHGVLKALMSGMLAGQFAAAASQDRRLEDEAIGGFRSWMNRRFDADAEQMSLFYANFDRPPGWTVGRSGPG